MKLKRWNLKAERMLVCFFAASALFACQPADGDDVQKTASLEQKMLNGSPEEGYDAVCALVRQRNNKLSLMATGTLIAPQWVLSAISSSALDNIDIDANLSQLFFAFGDSIKNEPRLVGVDRVVRYPYFVLAYGGYLPLQNVALYHLTEPVSDITPASIAEGEIEDWLDEDLQFVGFGAGKAKYIVNPEGGVTWDGDVAETIGVRNVSPMKVMDARLFAGERVSHPDPENGVYPSLLWVNDERFLTESDMNVLYGAAAGDEGSPAFIVEDGEKRMVATTDYANYVGGNLANRLKTYKPWIDAVIAGDDPDCNADKSVCSCDEACMPDGICNNWVCGELSDYSCAVVHNYFQRLWQYEYFPISAAYYFMDATYSGLSLHSEAIACLFGSGQDYSPCVELLAACMTDGSISGEVDCYETVACEFNCAEEDCGCLNSDRVSKEGALHDIEIYYCLDAKDCEPYDVDCAHQHCQKYLDACYETADCDVLQNGCPDGQACAPSVFHDPVCRPAGDKDEGEACRLGASDCKADLICSPVEQPADAVCVVPCDGHDDCGDGHCIVNSITIAWLGEGLGYCGEGSVCVDEDDDGSCAENDCDDHDPNVHPNAREICGDNIDQDCDGQTDEGCGEVPPDDAGTDSDVDASDAESDADASDDDASDAKVNEDADIGESDAGDAAAANDAGGNDAGNGGNGSNSVGDAGTGDKDDDDGGDDGCSAIPGHHSGGFLAFLSLPLLLLRRRPRA